MLLNTMQKYNNGLIYLLFGKCTIVTSWARWKCLTIFQIYFLTTIGTAITTCILCCATLTYFFVHITLLFSNNLVWVMWHFLFKKITTNVVILYYYNKIQITPPLPSLTILPRVFLILLCAFCGILTSFVWSPSFISELNVLPNIFVSHNPWGFVS